MKKKLDEEIGTGLRRVSLSQKSCLEVLKLEPTHGSLFRGVYFAGKTAPYKALQMPAG